MFLIINFLDALSFPQNKVQGVHKKFKFGFSYHFLIFPDTIDEIS